MSAAAPATARIFQTGSSDVHGLLGFTVFIEFRRKSNKWFTNKGSYLIAHNQG